MNASINSLLGPLEAATRQGSWEDAEDIAREISRLARLQRLSELQRIQETLGAGKVMWPGTYFAAGTGQDVLEVPVDHRKLKPYPIDPKMALGGSQVAKTPLPVICQTQIKQGESTTMALVSTHYATPEPSREEQWPFG